MADAWEILTSHSTIQSGDAWEHLTHLGSGPGGICVLADGMALSLCQGDNDIILDNNDLDLLLDETEITAYGTDESLVTDLSEEQYTIEMTSHNIIVEED